MLKHRDIHEVLKETWGYSSFRPLQEDIINSILDGNDTLALLPTGGGKSICFQVPALSIDGLCLVISPLIALMKDQVENLNAKKIKADALFSGQSFNEQMRIIDNVVYNNTKFLYVSPERLKTDFFLLNIEKLNISLIAVDEAHCISQWGYDFRPPYLDIAEIRQYLPNVPILALTATATPRVVKDIQDKLKFKKYNVLQKSFERKNLSYLVYKEDNKLGRLLRIAKNVEGTGIVYMRNRRGTVEIAKYLKDNGVSADFYHAGLSDKVRNSKQNDWKKDKTRVIVATNAFGMGIDKPNVRFVVHIDIPNNIESYFQEVGRAGRDEKPAFGVLLYNDTDVENLNMRFRETYPDIKDIQNIYILLGKYYRLSKGDAVNETFDFDISAFSQAYNLKSSIVYNSLKILEVQEAIVLSEAFHSPSRVMVKANRTELRNYQEQHKELDVFLQMLLRMYGGLFSEYVKIDEKLLSRQLNTTENDVVEMLKFVSGHNIIDYIPSSDTPKITFPIGYIDSKAVFSDVSYYKERKRVAKEKLNYMIAYVTNSTKCRSSMLLQYFGEDNNNARCKVCDYCRNKANTTNRKLVYDEITTKVLPLLKEKTLTMEQIHSAVHEIETNDLIACFRWLIDNDIINSNEDGTYSLNV